MTYPRSHLVDAANGGTYHVYTRCVRRAWLCGLDKLTGKNFDHRRTWIEKRIHELSTIFSVSIYAYAVMSNHYHIVLRISPERAQSWSDRDVAKKWHRLCPPSKELTSSNRLNADIEKDLISNKRRIAELRTRLSSLSWFMRFMNEPLARRANREDDCTGRFWEGRFKSQAILDEASLLACMIYVDLNPIRAGAAKSIENSKHTSIHYHLNSIHNFDLIQRDERLAVEKQLPFDLKLNEYSALARWSATTLQLMDTRSKLVAHSALQQSGISLGFWKGKALIKRTKWQRAIGERKSLRDYSNKLGQLWVKCYIPDKFIQR